MSNTAKEHKAEYTTAGTDKPQTFNRFEAATFCGLGERAFYRRYQRGEVAGTMIEGNGGQTLQFERAELLRFRETLTGKGGSRQPLKRIQEAQAALDELSLLVESVPAPWRLRLEMKLEDLKEVLT